MAIQYDRVTAHVGRGISEMDQTKPITVSTKMTFLPDGGETVGTITITSGPERGTGERVQRATDSPFPVRRKQ